MQKFRVRTSYRKTAAASATYACVRERLLFECQKASEWNKNVQVSVKRKSELKGKGMGGDELEVVLDFHEGKSEKSSNIFGIPSGSEADRSS